MVDVHNHDASGERYRTSWPVWDHWGVTKVVLFGDVSEPSAQATDRIALAAARAHPDRIVAFVAGVNILDPDYGAYLRAMFAQGARGVGEIVASSRSSPVVSRVPWKATGAADPRLWLVYQLCAEYRRPVLLHIDPLDGEQLGQLVQAARDFPQTDFILGHANAYSDPDDLRTLLDQTENLFLDFFAGFTVYHPDSRHPLGDFLALMEAYPDRFLVGSDSGFGVGYDRAYEAIRDTLDHLSPATARLVASGNIERLLAKARL